MDKFADHPYNFFFGRSYNNRTLECELEPERFIELDEKPIRSNERWRKTSPRHSFPNY